ncbi:MAG: hypothetical protein ACLP59_08210 [Bryobacteraceae bacterium]
MRYLRTCLVILGAGLIVEMPRLSAAPKGGSAADQIEVIAHLPVSGGRVTQLTTATHWSKEYLYVAHGSAGPVTILDVTNPSTPAETGQLDIPPQEAGERVGDVVGNVALFSSAPAPVSPRTVTIVSFADPEHPTVTQQFAGVTATVQDRARRLIYLANSDGLWVLRDKPATDMEAQREYARYVLYDR